MLTSKNNKCLANGANRVNLKRLNKDFKILVESSQVYAENRNKKKKSKSDDHFVVYDVIQPDKGSISEFFLVINGPVGTLYEGGKIIFKVSMKGNNQAYPFTSPKVTCVTSIYHPNIDKYGSICLDIIASGWAPSQTFVSIALSLSSFLDEPNPDDPLYPSAATLFKNDRKGYDKKVEDFVKKYATHEEYLRIKNGGNAKTTQSHINDEDNYDSDENNENYESEED